MRAVLAVALVAALGCDRAAGVDAGRDAAGATPRVELGTGTTSFQPLPPAGAALELVGGPQGGFHVDVTARIHDLDVEDLLITYAAVDAATRAPVGHPTHVRVRAARLVREGDGWVRVGDFVILHDSMPDPVRGLTLEITLRCEEVAGGRSAEDARVVTIVDEISG